MRIKLLICDLDKTLYDWVGYFVPSFYAMVDRVVEITGCDREKLLDDFRAVHQAHHDSEHPFSLFETDTMRQYFSGVDSSEMVRKLDPALHAFNSLRKQLLTTHLGVVPALEQLESRGVCLVAHTESRLYGAIDRLTRLDLTRFFRRVYCRERSNSQHPDTQRGTEWLSRFPLEIVTELSHHQSKPNADVLLEICDREGFRINECAYVGDSMARDMLMAKNAKVPAIWAQYGSRHSTELYEKLIRISHWTSADVAIEKELNMAAHNIKPDYTLRNDFSEILGVFESKASVGGNL